MKKIIITNNNKTMNNEKKGEDLKTSEAVEKNTLQDGPGESPQEKPKEREIVIKTDGNNVSIVKAEVTSLELRAILQLLLDGVNKK